MPDIHDFNRGDRVTAVLYGERKVGTVNRHTVQGIVWVRWDGSRALSWQHAESLALLEGEDR